MRILLLLVIFIKHEATVIYSELNWKFTNTILKGWTGVFAINSDKFWVGMKG